VGIEAASSFGAWVLVVPLCMKKSSYSFPLE